MLRVSPCTVTQCIVPRDLCTYILIALGVRSLPPRLLTASCRAFQLGLNCLCVAGNGDVGRVSHSAGSE